MRAFWAALAAALGLTLAVALPADAAPARTYTVTKTFGPYNGQAGPYDFGALPDGEALWVACGPDARPAGHRLTVNRMGGKQILRLYRQGVEFSRYEPDDRWMFYAWFRATGKPGWNKVTMSITCRR